MKNSINDKASKSRIKNVPTEFVEVYINSNSCDIERMNRIKSIMARMIAEHIKKTVK